MTSHTAVIDAGSTGTRLPLYRVEPGPLARVEKLLEKEFSTMASGAEEDGINDFVRLDDAKAGARVVPEIIDPLMEHARRFLGTMPGIAGTCRCVTPLEKWYGLVHNAEPPAAARPWEDHPHPPAAGGVRAGR